MSQMWAITADAFNRIRGLDLSAGGPVPEAAGKVASRREKSVAVLPLRGILSPHITLMEYLFGDATSTSMFAQEFIAARDDDRVGAIAIPIHSPGGSVAAVTETSNLIYAARGIKPIIAIVSYQASSAGYWIGSAADRMYGSPSARQGGIGILAVHQDTSAAHEKAGVKEFVVTSSDSPHKAEWAESQPANPDYLAELQRMVDESHKVFVGDVARNRGHDVAYINEHFGKGRELSSKRAKDVGMIDEIATYEDVLGRMVAGKIRLRRDNAQALRTTRLQSIQNYY